MNAFIKMYYRINHRLTIGLILNTKSFAPKVPVRNTRSYNEVMSMGKIISRQFTDFLEKVVFSVEFKKVYFIFEL